MVDDGWLLLERIAQGDGDALGDLVEIHQERVLRLCQRLLGDVEEARDAAQEIFLKLYRGAATFKPKGQVYTLVYRIAVNFCLNRLRRRRLVQFFRLAGPEEAEDGAPSLDPPAPGPDPAAALESRRRWRVTRKAIEALPAGQRSVLILARFEGLSYKEIAEVLGITLGAVESRLFRAMRALALAQEDFDSGVSRKDRRS